jgi:hypothetical protein
MVWPTEEIVFRPPGGGIEGRAFRNRVSVQARAHRFIMNLVHVSGSAALTCTRGPAPLLALARIEERIRKIVSHLAKSEGGATLFPVTDAKPASGRPQGEGLAKRL